MLLLGLCMAITVIFGVIAHVWYYECDVRETLAFIFTIISVITGIVAAIMIIIAIIVNTGTEGKLESDKQLYNALVYQLENNLYENDNDIGKKELYSEVVSWNRYVAKGNKLQHDMWIGIFTPNIFDDLQLIEFPDDGGK